MLLLNQYKTKELIRLIEERLSVIDVMKRVGIKVVKVGGVWRAYCFAHNDTGTPNLSHTEGSINCAHCFKCGYAGGPIKIYRDYCKKTFPEALQELAEVAGINISQYVRESTPEEIEKQKVMDLNSMIANWLHQQAHANAGVMQYLLGRYDKPSLEKWKIGYSKSGEELRKYIIQTLKIPYSIFQKADIQSWRFDDRIIYPIFDMYGNIVGFSNRTWANSKEEEEKKYGNIKKGGKYSKFVNTSSASIIFKQKSKYLYGLNFARDAIKKNKGRVIIVEGFSDVIAMHKHGFENCVGIMSSSFNSNSIEALSSIGVTNVVFCLDGDEAGQDKTMLVMKSQKRLQGFLKDGALPVRYRAVSMPIDIDPDVFLEKKGKKAMQALLDNAMSLPEFYVNYAIKEAPELKTITDRLEFIQGIKNALKDAIEPAETALIEHFLAEKFGISKTDFDAFCQMQQINTEETDNLEEKILFSLVDDGAFRNKAVPSLSVEMFLHPNSTIFRAILALHAAKKTITIDDVIKQMQHLGFDRYFKEASDINAKFVQHVLDPYQQVVLLRKQQMKREIINLAGDLISRCQFQTEEEIIRFIKDKLSKMDGKYEIQTENSK